MKTIFLMAAMHCFAFMSVHAASPIRSFEDGVKAYQSGDYQVAIQHFHAVEQEGYDNFLVSYNLGNSYYKNGNLGKGIFYYERALLHDPGNVQIQKNLKVAAARIRDRVDPIPLLFFVRWWNDVKSAFRPDVFFYVSLFFLYLVAVGLFIFFGFRQLMARRVALSGVIVFGLFFILSIVLYTARLDDYSAHRFGIIMNTQLTVLSTPDASGIESFNVHEGLKVEILEFKKEFYRIRLADGKNGWIPRTAVERI